MRANGFKLLFLGLATCLLAAPSFAQVPVVVQEQGTQELLPDSNVRWSTDGLVFDTAANLGDGLYEIPISDTKIMLNVEHPNFGSNTVEVQLPQAGDGTVVTIYVDNQTGMAKALLFDGVRNLTRVATQGAPVPPPPGQGCQLPDQLGHGSAGYVALVSDRTSPFKVAECFRPVNNDQLTHAVWWGAYVNIVFGLGTDCGPGPGDDFQITYYNDGGGQPGTVLAGPFSVGLTQKFQTGNLLMGFADEWQFQSTFHAPVNVTAGTTYWIEITNNTVGDADCFWLWSTAPPGDDHCYQTDFDGVTWVEKDTDMAVCINFLIEPDGCGGGPGESNDECVDCEPISGEGTFDFDNTTATSGGPDHLECDEFGSQAVDNDVWFCWTAPCDGNVTAETCGLTAVDTKMAVYDGTDCGSLAGSILDCNDDTCGLQSQVTWTAVSGNTYLLRIGTFPGAAGGTGQFSISCGGAGPPANDECADAIAIGLGTTSGTTEMAGIDAAAPFCVTGITSPGVWYEVTGTGNTMTASVCNAASFDTKINVYCGDCAGLICVNGNDDGAGCAGFTSEVSWCSISGQSYLVLVHGFGGASGTFDLTISDDGTPCAGPVACAEPLTTALDIGSNLAGVFVSVQPVDLFGHSAGNTPFTRAYDLLTEVTITAPATWEHNGKTTDLMGWLINDRVVRPRLGSLTGIITEAKRVKALYSDGDVTPSGDVLHRR